MLDKDPARVAIPNATDILCLINVFIQTHCTAISTEVEVDVNGFEQEERHKSTVYGSIAKGEYFTEESKCTFCFGLE